MNNTTSQKNQKPEFFLILDKAAAALHRSETDAAYALITEAMLLEPDFPQPHNLLGIYFELSGDVDRARRHYRAAYALDPTYTPALGNLERLCLTYESKPLACDFGIGVK